MVGASFGAGCAIAVVVNARAAAARHQRAPREKAESMKGPPDHVSKQRCGTIISGNARIAAGKMPGFDAVHRLGASGAGLLGSFRLWIRKRGDVLIFRRIVMGGRRQIKRAMFDRRSIGYEPAPSRQALVTHDEARTWPA